MPETIVECNGREGFAYVQLAVRRVGMVITVESGEAMLSGRDASLREDKSYVVEPSSAYREIAGFLVRDTDEDEVTVLVDEMEADEAPFQFEGSAYTPLCQLFRLELPGDATTLEDAVLRVYRLLPTPPPSSGEE